MLSCLSRVALIGTMACAVMSSHSGHAVDAPIQLKVIGGLATVSQHTPNSNVSILEPWMFPG